MAHAGAPDGRPPLIAYFRVSTARQGASGLGLEAQRTTVLEHVARLGGSIIHEFTDVESGKKDNRPELLKALEACRRHRGRLIVAKLDRLARNAAFLLTLHDGLKNDAAGVYFCDLPQLPEGPIGILILSVMAAIAQWERGVISERTIAALAAKKAQGFKLGNPNLRPAGAGAARKRQARRHAESVMPAIRRAEKAGADTLERKAEALNALGIKTPGGKAWRPETVRRVLMRSA